MFKLPPLAVLIEPALIIGWPVTQMVPLLTLAEIVPWLTTMTFNGPPKQL